MINRKAIKYKIEKELSRLASHREIYNYNIVYDATINTPELVDNNELVISVFIREKRHDGIDEERFVFGVDEDRENILSLKYYIAKGLPTSRIHNFLEDDLKYLKRESNLNGLLGD